MDSNSVGSSTQENGSLLRSQAETLTPDLVGFVSPWKETLSRSSSNGTEPNSSIAYIHGLPVPDIRVNDSTPSEWEPQILKSPESTYPSPDVSEISSYITAAEYTPLSAEPNSIADKINVTFASDTSVTSESDPGREGALSKPTSSTNSPSVGLSDSFPVGLDTSPSSGVESNSSSKINDSASDSSRALVRSNSLSADHGVTPSSDFTDSSFSSLVDSSTDVSFMGFKDSKAPYEVTPDSQRDIPKFIIKKNLDPRNETAVSTPSIPGDTPSIRLDTSTNMSLASIRGHTSSTRGDTLTTQGDTSGHSVGGDSDEEYFEEYHLPNTHENAFVRHLSFRRKVLTTPINAPDADRIEGLVRTGELVRHGSIRKRILPEEDEEGVEEHIDEEIDCNEVDEHSEDVDNHDINEEELEEKSSFSSRIERDIKEIERYLSGEHLDSPPDDQPIIQSERTPNAATKIKRTTSTPKSTAESSISNGTAGTKANTEKDLQDLPELCVDLEETRIEDSTLRKIQDCLDFSAYKDILNLSGRLSDLLSPKEVEEVLQNSERYRKYLDSEVFEALSLSFQGQTQSLPWNINTKTHSTDSNSKSSDSNTSLNRNIDSKMDSNYNPDLNYKSISKIDSDSPNLFNTDSNSNMVPISNSNLVANPELNLESGSDSLFQSKSDSNMQPSLYSSFSQIVPSADKNLSSRTTSEDDQDLSDPFLVLRHGDPPPNEKSGPPKEPGDTRQLQNDIHSCKWNLKRISAPKISFDSSTEVDFDPEEANKENAAVPSTKKKIAVSKAIMNISDDSLSFGRRDDAEDVEGAEDAEDALDIEVGQEMRDDITSSPSPRFHTSTEVPLDLGDPSPPEMFPAPPPPDLIPELLSSEEMSDIRHWRNVVIGGAWRRIDMKVIASYRKCISHGGYMEDSQSPIVVLSAALLPEKSRRDYHYLMDNLFMYVLSFLEQLVSDDYVLVYFSGGVPNGSGPGFSWMRRAYEMIDRRLRKNLKSLLVVHPSLWARTLVTLSRPFISAKFYRKLKFVHHLTELAQVVPLEQLEIPDAVKHADFQIMIKEKKRKRR